MREGTMPDIGNVEVEPLVCDHDGILAEDGKPIPWRSFLSRCARTRQMASCGHGRHLKSKGKPA